jgi:flavin reductase (DIM6/NTAB) family NADH-FMN oxidoreductase RutF
MKIIYPDSFPSRDLHQFMLGSVIPRPIALVSTLSESGINNLAPFSYFNAISSDPPILGFSVSDRKDGSSKDTLANIEENSECVINLVSYDISHQMTLAGIDFPPETDEFVKCGFTPASSISVLPKGIEQSPVRFECKTDRIIYFGEKGNQTALVVCNVLCIHYDEIIMNKDNRIDPVALNLVGRLGRTNYIRLSNENIFSINQSRSKIPVGYDNLPKSIVQSKILTGNEIALIAGMENIPDPELINTNRQKYKLIATDINSAHKLASELIKSGNIEEAAALLFFSF